MISYSNEDFAGQACIRLDNDSLSLWATTSVGPRILGLALRDGTSPFAQLPHVTLDCPGSGKFHFYGGHRLWYTPEYPPITYLPDDLTLDVQQIEDGICLTQPVQQMTFVQKQMLIHLPNQEAQVLVEHVLYNRGDEPIELASWAITQLRTGGEALLPVTAPAADPYGVLPNRRLALWSYSDVEHAGMRLGKRLLRIRARADSSMFKVGFPNPSGWMAYWLEDTLFVKQSIYQAEADYPDHGSSSECYCDHRFLELESLGGRVRLQPGELTRHVETWRLVGGIAPADDEAGWLETLNQLGLTLAGG